MGGSGGRMGMLPIEESGNVRNGRKPVGLEGR